jgi:hypothetical protein
VNPNYQPPNRYVRPGVNSGPVIAPTPSAAAAIVEAVSESGNQAVQPPPPVIAGQKKEVMLGGVAFESSGRSLVRKDRELLVCIRSLSILL